MRRPTRGWSRRRTRSYTWLGWRTRVRDGEDLEELFGQAGRIGDGYVSTKPEAAMVEQFRAGIADHHDGPPPRPDGQAGLVRMLEILETEILSCMGLLGVQHLSELSRAYLRAAPVVTDPRVFSSFPLLTFEEQSFY